MKSAAWACKEKKVSFSSTKNVSGTILTRVQFHGATRDFSATVNFLSRLSYGGPAVPPVHQQLLVHNQTKPKTTTKQQQQQNKTTTNKQTEIATLPLFGHMKMLHILVGIGSAAPAAAVQPFPGRATRISHTGY